MRITTLLNIVKSLRIALSISRFILILLWTMTILLINPNYAKNFLNTFSTNGTLENISYEKKEKIPWTQWVDSVVNFDELEEDLEEIAPTLQQLEFWYNYPQNVNALNNKDLEIFYWLTTREKKNFFNFKQTNFFTNLSDLYTKKIFYPESYNLILPFLKLKKKTKTSVYSPLEDIALNHPTTINYGIAIRAKKLKRAYDFVEVLKNYQIKIFGNIQQKNIFDFYYLAERDPNEIKILDLSKWSLSIQIPQIDTSKSFSENRFTIMGGSLSIKIHQSLLLSTGYPIRKNEKAPHSIKKNSSRLYNDKSSQEIFFQGVASDFVLNDWRMATWVGRYVYDQVLKTNTGNQLYAEKYSFYSSIHRPSPKNNLSENLIGFLVEKYLGYHSLSIAFLYSEFSHPIITSSSNKFYGKSHFGISVGWKFDFNRYRWYGETVLLFNEKKDDNPWIAPTYRASGAFATGGRIFFPNSNFFLSFRFIPPNYQAVHNLAYTRYDGNDEFGVLGGYYIRPIPRLTLVSSFDFFKRLSKNFLKFGMDISQLIKYQHYSGYYKETQIRLRERGEWDNDYNHFWEIKHRSGWKNQSWLFFGEAKFNGNLISNLTDSDKGSYPFGVLLTLHGEFRQDLSTSVIEIMWSQQGPRTFYDLLYHNKFFFDFLYLNKGSFLIFFRQEFRLHSLLATGFSLIFYWDNSQGNLFHSPQPNRTMFSFYVSGEIEAK